MINKTQKSKCCNSVCIFYYQGDDVIEIKCNHCMKDQNMNDFIEQKPIRFNVLVCNNVGFKSFNSNDIEKYSVENTNMSWFTNMTEEIFSEWFPNIQLKPFHEYILTLI